MASRTQLVCLCEGEVRKSIDPIFINRLIRDLSPAWLRPFGSNTLRIEACGNRERVIERLPSELKACIRQGGRTTLIVWADCDHDCASPEELKKLFWDHAKLCSVNEKEFSQVVFVFAKDRLENWIEFLTTGKTDEGQEGARFQKNDKVREAAILLAGMCKTQERVNDLPASLAWSCKNWKALCDRLK
jgi:hypothetical protein